jgi:hypothetical protein
MKQKRKGHQVKKPDGPPGFCWMIWGMARETGGHTGQYTTTLIIKLTKLIRAAKERRMVGNEYEVGVGVDDAEVPKGLAADEIPARRGENGGNWVVITTW